MMSSLPNSRTAVCAIFSGKSGAVTLPTQAVATPPAALIELTTPSTVSPSRSLTTTWAPCSAKKVATARPMPRPEPVTIADLPSSNFILDLILSELHWEQLAQLRGGELGAVLAELEGFGVTNLPASLLAVPLNQRLTVTI